MPQNVAEKRGAKQAKSGQLKKQRTKRKDLSEERPAKKRSTTKTTKRSSNENEFVVRDVSYDDLPIGSTVTGQVQELNEDGLLLEIDDGRTAFVPKVHIRENCESKNLARLFPVGKQLTGRVFKVDKSVEPARLCLTLRKSFISPAFELLTDLEQYKPGLQTIGMVCSIKESGLLLEFFNNVHAWVTKQNLPTEPSAFKVGQLLLTTIIRIENDRIFATIGQQSASVLASKSTNSALSQVGFNWNFDPKSNLGESSDEEASEEERDAGEENEQERRRGEKRKTRNAREYEEYLRKKENDLVDLNREPETKDDFERMVISSPNSSLVWIKYMSMYIEQKLYDKARQVGERALQTVAFREEQEKFNIWIAMLNLENKFGNEESFFILYRRAQLQLEPLKLFKSLIKIYLGSELFDKAEEAYAFHQKKLKQYKEFWLDYGLFYYRCNKLDKARNVLEQSLKSLDKQEHVDVISKFAQMEFRSGDIERGKTLFESLLSTYPKRVDLWLVYLDVMQKYGRSQEVDNNACLTAIRNIFERVITIRLKANRMKTVFKKYLEFESKYGNKSTIERVKEKMKTYVDENPFSAK